MKLNWNFFLLSISIFIFFSCKDGSIKKEFYYNGINSQILNIVDSMQICDDLPFVTISFLVCDTNKYVIRFFNGLVIPPPPPPPAPIKEALISEANGFRGYKKYGDIYLVFEESYFTENFDKFVNKDSLSFNESPFVKFNVYDYDGRRSDCEFIEKKYLINEADSLIYYDGKCLFDVE